jgi:hypothetical protein
MDSMSVFCANWKMRLVAFGIGVLIAAAVFGIALAVSDDLRLLYVSGALLFAFAAFLLGAPAREDWVADCSTCFRIDVLVRSFCFAANTFSWAGHSVVGGDCRVAAIPAAIR